jgi:conjugal transfer pilus assembly protein TraD
MAWYFDTDTDEQKFLWPVASGEPEREAAVGWLVVALACALFAALGWIGYTMGAAGLFAAAARAGWLLTVGRAREGLAGVLSLRRISASTLHRFARHSGDHVYLGEGGPWTPSRARIAYRITQSDISHSMYRGRNPDRESGALWLRLLEGKPKPLVIPGNFQAGHLLVLGATGAGKTRFLDMLVNQAVARGEPVVVIDPKTDKDLRSLLRSSMERIGRGDRYWELILSDPDHSCRLNPNAHYFDPKDIADRIASLMPSSKEGVFHAFPAMALQRITQNLDLCGIRPTYTNIAHYLDHPAELLAMAIDAHLSPRMANWESEAKPYLQVVTSMKKVSDEEVAEAYSRFYNEVVHPRFPNAGIAGLIQQAVHDRAHFSRMITSLMPIMSTLTSGHVGPLLSPDPYDESDTRPIADIQRIINQGGALYIGTSGLSNRTAGSFLSAAICADLAATAAGRYQSHQYEDAGGIAHSPDKPVHLFVDEAVEVLNDPFIALLNKSRGANFRITLSTQTISDIPATLGSKDRAMQTLGNVNNIVMFRSRDPETIKFFETVAPTINLRTADKSESLSRNAMGKSESQSSKVGESEIAMVPKHILTQLPDLEHFCALKSGEILHGRVPLVVDSKKRPPTGKRKEKH